MPFLVSENDNTAQEETERRRAEQIARKVAKDESRWRIVKAKRREKYFFPNLTGEFDEDSSFAKHFTRKGN